MKKLNILKNTTLNICLILIIVSSVIFILNKRIILPLDNDILHEQKVIIEILASYFFAEGTPQLSQGLLTVYISWTIAVLIESVILADPKKITSNIVSIVIFICFFLLVFGFRHSPNYFNINIPLMIFNIVILGMYLGLISIFSGLLLRKIYNHKNKDEESSIIAKDLAGENRSICPHCRTEFESVPLYCYNCSKKIITKDPEN